MQSTPTDRARPGGADSERSHFVEPMSAWRSRVAGIKAVQVVAALGVLILGLVTAAAVQGAFPTPAARQPNVIPVALPTPTSTANDVATRPTATAPPQLLQPLDPPTVFDETFADNSAGWPSASTGPGVLGRGSYQLTARQPHQFVAVAAPIAQVFGDLVVRAVFRKLGGPPGGGYGIIVRDQGPGPRDGVNQGGRYYVLEIGDKGEVGIWRRADDQWIELVPWTVSQSVHPGTAVNEVGVQAIGDRLTLLVNGTEVAASHDATLAYGKVGVFVGGDLNEVALDQFRVRSAQ